MEAPDDDVRSTILGSVGKHASKSILPTEVKPESQQPDARFVSSQNRAGPIASLTSNQNEHNSGATLGTDQLTLCGYTCKKLSDDEERASDAKVSVHAGTAIYQHFVYDQAINALL